MIRFFFWFSALTIIYTYFGYPLILWIVAKFLTKPVNKNDGFLSKVSILMSVYNEEEQIRRKIDNLLGLDYPRGNFEVIIGSDGSTDATNSIIEKYAGKIKFFKTDSRQGKISLLNSMVPQASGEILVFTDARQILAKDALKNLVSNFADTSVGCVSGELILEKTDRSSIGEGLGLYWNYEKFLRKTESRLDSMIGATGALYAIRKNLYTSAPANTILDDVFIPLAAVRQGFRAIFEPNALVYDWVSEETKGEFSRKARTLAGNFQIFLEFKEMFNPLKSRISWQLFSHKFLRAVLPIFLILNFLANLLMLDSMFFRNIFILQVLFYGLALVAAIFKKMRRFNIPYVFCVLNFSALVGLYRFLFHKQEVTWQKAVES